MNSGKKIDKTKKAWPTKAAMEQVYEMNLWGGKKHEFYSGEGSHLPEIVIPYLESVTSFLTSFKSSIRVCDLGCGDFNVGKNLVKFTKKYIAVDIVPDLIASHKEKYKAKNLEFHCNDIASDNLPQADCAILRQILQHLSNSEVEKVVNKLANYQYIILTEHIPNTDFIPNKNIISGQGTRLKKNSGLNLLMPPFNLKIKEKKQLASVPSKNNTGSIVTWLYKMF